MYTGRKCFKDLERSLSASMSELPELHERKSQCARMQEDRSRCSQDEENEQQSVMQHLVFLDAVECGGDMTLIFEKTR